MFFTWFGSHITALESALYYTEYYVFLQKKVCNSQNYHGYLIYYIYLVLEPALYHREHTCAPCEDSVARTPIGVSGNLYID